WRRLGPDALTITSAELAKRLRRTRRAVKAALLDQSVLAGVGNIYADEALFGSRLHPARRADGLARAEVRDLARELRRTLGRAVDSGGSSLRDYVDAEGRKGGYAAYHQVYGRGGEPCVRCSTRLERMLLAQRTTVFCPQCQQGRGRIEEGVPCEVQKHRP
ncbi:MAG: Fpg/Nei family DNA glycosylase, partial [Planctomycetota bacterium]